MLVIQKYGGTSVATVKKIQSVAIRALASQAEGHQVVVVVSAMAGETNRLLSLANQVTSDALDREVDVIVSTGEQITSALTALAIRKEAGELVRFWRIKSKCAPTTVMVERELPRLI